MCFQHFNSDRYLGPHPAPPSVFPQKLLFHFHENKKFLCKEMRARKTRSGGVKDVGGREPFVPKSPSAARAVAKITDCLMA